MQKAIRWCLLILICGVLLFSGFKLGSILWEYHEGTKSYLDVSDRVMKKSQGETPAQTAADVQEPLQPAAPQAQDEATPAETLTAPIEIDFDELLHSYPNAVGWLYNEGTRINYPVMQAKDNDYYLYRLPDGKSNGAGSLFLDCDDSPDFSDSLSVIFGHNMKNGSMFASLLKYREKGYYEQHPQMWLLTPNGTKRLDLFAGCTTDGYKVAELMKTTPQDMQGVIDWAIANSSFKSDVEVSPEDRVIVLSTCSYSYDDARYIVLAKIVQ